jgi:hypothetical protein
VKVGELFGWLTLRDHNSDFQVISVGLSVLVRTLATLKVGDLEHSQVLPSLCLLIRVFRAVVRWVNETSSLIVGLEVRDDIAPCLVTVDAQSDDEVPARLGHETEGTRRPAFAHREQMVVVDLVPGSTLCVSPDGLLDDTEVARAGIVLEYKHLDLITHFL